MTDQPQKYPRSFHVVAKPLGSTCNLDCTYCYYQYKESGRITDELLEKFIRQYIAGQTNRQTGQNDLLNRSDPFSALSVFCSDPLSAPMAAGNMDGSIKLSAIRTINQSIKKGK